jgi:hypothetical protein
MYDHLFIGLTPHIHMKKSILTCIALLCLISSFGQSDPQRILGSVIYKNQVFNYEFSKDNIDNYSFRVSQSRDSIGNPPVQRQQDSIPIIYFSQFNKEILIRSFVQQMTAKFHMVSGKELEDKGAEIFFSIQARLDFVDDEPVTAYVILKKNNVSSLLKVNASPFYDGRLSHFVANHVIHRVDIETEDGAIKNIIAKLISPEAVGNDTQSPRSFLEFKNQFPISISGKFDPEKISDIDLYCFNCGGVRGLTRQLPLSSLIMLDIVLTNDKEDYSPSNRTVSVSPHHPISELKKEERSKIVEISAFSDFVGLDQEQPNGLVQIDARRKININTKSHLLFSNRKKQDLSATVNLSNVESYTSEKYNNRYLVYKVVMKEQSRDYDFMNKNSRPKSKRDTLEVYVKTKRNSFTFFNTLGGLEPRLLFSKLEENNRYVPLSNISENKVRPLQLYQYQLVSFGATLNVIRFSFPQLKVNWSAINVGYYWFRTRLEASPTVTGPASIPINSNYISLGSHFAFRPDNRWGFGFGADYLRLSIFNPDYFLVNSKGLYQGCFDGFFKTNATSKLFFRFRWIAEAKDRNYNYNQIQLGYSINLFGTAPDRIKN